MRGLHWPIQIELATAVLNLAINARDAMPNGRQTRGPDQQRLSRRKLRELAERGHARELRDDRGRRHRPRNSTRTLERVFEPFFTTKEVGKGTGLGLSMVFGSVKQLGGHIKIYSEEGHGTSVKDLPAVGDGIAANRGGSAGPADIEGGNETVLIVEDDTLVRRYVMTQIKSLGYTTLEAANASTPCASSMMSPPSTCFYRRDHARHHQRPPARRRSA